jgi:hypothetical protein
MSRQVHIYLLPADVESLVNMLRERVGISLIQPWSPGPQIVPLPSAILNDSMELGKGSVRVDCYLVQPEAADIRLRFVPGRSRWHVDVESEVVEFSGCEFDKTVLLRGRLYFQKDFLVGDNIVPKRREFLRWADQVFRLTRQSLYRSKVLDAYLGEAAKEWAQQGGRFAWTATPERGPIYVSPFAPG